MKIPSSSLQDTIFNCTLCDRSKTAKPTFGILPPVAKIIFITELPVVDPFGIFLQNKSSKMLQDIISNVFCLNISEYGVLSLIKCNENNLKITDTEVLICKRYLNEQVISKNIKIMILMGEKVLQHFYGLNVGEYLGKIFSHEGKKILATYSLNQLLKNPSLKKETLTHFLALKKEVL
ncbi:uracil-DNA glycosylase family protein [Helicobacter sp. 13S00477-4]|uniref:uracil-DNA glycosylase family protein n=1 Tax=Helicobacter sp. 13S00477-4 TaxID=1905759 RepID=UPI0015D9A06E|nr:uracil-DNA glycosylase family protein [Helicobacter sp. 13S00477-4]